jgi:hypothetical protein
MEWSLNEQHRVFPNNHYRWANSDDGPNHGVFDMSHLVDVFHGHLSHCYQCPCGWGRTHHTDCKKENQKTISDGQVFLLEILGKWEIIAQEARS